MENLIQQALNSKKMTQAQLAGKAGIKREYLNKIINSHITPTVGLALRISRAMGMQVEELFATMDLEKKQGSAILHQDKIIDFMLKENISISDLYNAVCLNEQQFMDRLLVRLQSQQED